MLLILFPFLDKRLLLTRILSETENPLVSSNENHVRENRPERSDRQDRFYWGILALPTEYTAHNSNSIVLTMKLYDVIYCSTNARVRRASRDVIVKFPRTSAKHNRA